MCASIVLVGFVPGRSAAQTEGPRLGMLAQMEGIWSGQGQARLGPRGPRRRVDCIFELHWTAAPGRLKQSLTCRGLSIEFRASGELDALDNFDALSGFASMSEGEAGMFAHGSVSGRALTLTLVERGRGNSDRLLTVAGGRALWITVLNRGGHRIGTVIRRPDEQGMTSYEVMSVSLRRRSTQMPEVAPVPPRLPRPVPRATMPEPPISR